MVVSYRYLKSFKVYTEPEPPRKGGINLVFKIKKYPITDVQV